MTLNQKERWNIIYPAYLNSNRTLASGRRIPQSKAVADPRWQEIKDALESVGSFEVLHEPNSVYTRELDKEFPVFRGRVKYRVIKDEDKFGRKINVILMIADSISKIKNRKTMSAPTAGPSQTTEPVTSSVTGKQGKKGKKK